MSENHQHAWRAGAVLVTLGLAGWAAVIGCGSDGSGSSPMPVGMPVPPSAIGDPGKDAGVSDADAGVDGKSMSGDPRPSGQGDGGAPLWAKQFAGGQAHAVATDASNNVVVVGAFTGTTDVGGGPLASAGGADVFVVKLAPDGQYLWGKRLGGIGDQRGLSVAVSTTGEIVVGGKFEKTLDVGATSLVASSFSDAFITKLAGDGTHLWSKQLHSGYEASVLALAFDANGDVVLGGTHHGTIDFGGGVIPFGGRENVFLARFDPSGNHLFGYTYGTAQLNESLAGIGLDDAGSVTVSGYFPATIKFGDAGDLVAAGWSAGSPLLRDDVFFATLDRGGALVRSGRLGSTSNDRCTAFALDPGGMSALSCQLEAPVSLDGGTVAAGGALLKLDPLGGLGFARPLPSTSGVDVAGPHGVTFDSAGNVLACGSYRGSFDFGGGPLVTSGSLGNAFIVKHDSSGTHRFSQRFGNGVTAGAQAIVTDTTDAIVIVGSFAGVIDFGAGPMQSASGAAFVAKFGP